MNRIVSTTLGAALLIAGALVPAQAEDFKLGSLEIEQPWARASAGPARNGAAFLVIHNSGAADRLVAAAGDVAKRVELHTHKMEGDVMKMRQVEAVEVPAKGMATLQPGGYHVMMIGLVEPLTEGGSFPLTLTFEKAGEITVDVQIEAVGSMGKTKSMNQGGMNHGGEGHGEMQHGTMPKSN